MSSHYALLSLAPSATPEQVRASYLRLAKERHPDRAPPELREGAKRAFQELAAAYSVLSDPVLRRECDAALAHSTPPPPPPPPSTHPHPHPHPHPSTSTRRPSAAAPDSPFPGFRVPPGGYPRPPARPLDPHQHFAPHAPLEPRRARSTPQAHAVEFELDPLSGLDPLEGLLGALALGERRMPDEGPRAGWDGGREGAGAWEGWGGVPSWARREGGWGDGGARRQRREWREGRREANGEGFSVQGTEEVEHLPGGGIAWRGETVSVSCSAGYSSHPSAQHPAYPPHDPFPPPPPPPSRRAPSPAQLAFPPSPSHTQRNRSSSSLSHPAPPYALPPPSRRPPSPARTPSHPPAHLALPPAPPHRPRPPQHQHPHGPPPNPQHPSRTPRQAPSPARGPQLAFAGRAQAQAQLALTAQAHAHASPRAAVGHRRMSVGEVGGGRAPESVLFG
ncbi:hypothetical protein JCM8208_001391 [Rhodotorula glutinis]